LPTAALVFVFCNELIYFISYVFMYFYLIEFFSGFPFYFVATGFFLVTED